MQPRLIWVLAYLGRGRINPTTWHFQPWIKLILRREGGLRTCPPRGAHFSLDWPSETDWAKLLAQLVVFKGESGGSTAVPARWGKKMNKKFVTKEAPDWWSEELAKWANQQRTFGRAFKKPASKRSPTEKRYAKKTTRRRVALLDGIGCLT